MGLNYKIYCPLVSAYIYLAEELLMGQSLCLPLEHPRLTTIIMVFIIIGIKFDFQKKISLDEIFYGSMNYVVEK